MITVCFTRRMDLIHAGRLGIFPRLTKEGDVICMVHVGERLLICRPWDNTECGGRQYRLLGTYYVNELMDGEALDLGVEEHDDIILI